MKNIIIIVLSAITAVAILEALGTIDWIDKDTVIMVLDAPKSCDNGKREPAKPLEGGGISIKEDECSQYIAKFDTAKQLNKRNWFYLSKVAIDSIFSKDVAANGLSIFPVIDATDSMNIVVAPVISEHTLINANYGYASFLTQTFCPSDCDVTERMMSE